MLPKQGALECTDFHCVPAEPETTQKAAFAHLFSVARASSCTGSLVSRCQFRKSAVLQWEEQMKAKLRITLHNFVPVRVRTTGMKMKGMG